jgi:hypothetical protein
MDDIDLLPADLRARSIIDREIVLSYRDVLQAIDLLEAAHWAILGWEGWLHYADGSNGFAGQFPGPSIDREQEEPGEPGEALVHRSAAACRSTIEEAQQRWTIQPERSDADLFFCLTAADVTWFEDRSP